MVDTEIETRKGSTDLPGDEGGVKGCTACEVFSIESESVW